MLCAFGVSNEADDCYTSRVNKTKQGNLSQRPVLEWASFSNTRGFQMQRYLLFLHLALLTELFANSIILPHD